MKIVAQAQNFYGRIITKACFSRFLTTSRKAAAELIQVNFILNAQNSRSNPQIVNSTCKRNQSAPLHQAQLPKPSLM